MEYKDIIKNINILLVDDDKDYLMLTSAFFKQAGYNIDIAESGTMALEKLKEKSYQILLIDYFMPDMTGEQVIEKLRETNKEIIIILQTGFSGQNPPKDMLKKLNIQNYFDKTEGIDRLELEVISAIRIVAQQNQIELSKYKSTAMGDLITSIAEEMKQVLLSVSAGIDAVGILVNDTDKMEKVFDKNKEYLDNLDKLLTSILSSSNTDSVVNAKDMMCVIDAIAHNVAKKANVNYTSKISLKDSNYIVGVVNDIVFILSVLIKEVILISKESEEVEFILTDDEENWYFKINSSRVKDIPSGKIYNTNKVVSNIAKLEMNVNENDITLIFKK